MKKFYKCTGITMAICLVVGLACAMIGVLKGASGAIVVTKDFGFQIIEDVDRISHTDMDIEPFDRVNIEIDNAQINIVASTDGKYGVEYNLVGKESSIECVNKDGELTIRDASSDGNFYIGLFTFGASLFDDNEITIYVPEIVALQSVDIVCDAGDIYVGGIRGIETLKIEADASDVDIEKGVYGTIDINVDAGDVNIESVQINSLMRSLMDAGDVDIKGIIEGDIYIEVDAGDIDLATGVELSQYSYDLSVSMGNVDAFGMEDGGIDGALRGNNNGKYSMYINVSMGDITVNK